MPSPSLVDHYLRALLASGLGIETLDDGAIRAAAIKRVSEIELRIAELNRAGNMQALNQEYKAYRLARKAEGKGAKPYRFWIFEKKKELIANAAKHGGLR